MQARSAPYELLKTPTATAPPSVGRSVYLDFKGMGRSVIQSSQSHNHNHNRNLYSTTYRMDSSAEQWKYDCKAEITNWWKIMSLWYAVRLSEQYSFQVTLKSRNTVDVTTHRCGKLIPGFRARDGERSGSHWRWRSLKVAGIFCVRICW